MAAFSEISNHLEKLQSFATAAEVQGLLCALHCLDREAGSENWRDLFVSGYDPQDLLARESWEQLLLWRAETLQMLDDDCFSLKLCLPDDDDSLEQRTEALAMWCQGFIIALDKVAGKNVSLQADTRELLDDFISISQAEYSNIEENNENEHAFLELSEFVRMGVLFLYNQLGSRV